MRYFYYRQNFNGPPWPVAALDPPNLEPLRWPKDIVVSPIYEVPDHESLDELRQKYPF